MGPDGSRPAYRRVLLNLGGEMFGGGAGGVDPDVVVAVAQPVAGVGSPSCSTAAWSAAGPTTWACSGPS